MLSISVSSILERARFFLNDQNIQYFTNAILSEPFKTAYDDLREECYDNDIRIIAEVSAALEVEAEITDIGGPTGPALPIDFVVPVTLWERPNGTTIDYARMSPFRTLPKVTTLTNYLMYWSYRKQYIEFIGANQDIDVKIDYIGNTLGFPDDAEDRINMFNAKSFLSYRTAALAAQYQGENEERAQGLNSNARQALDKLLNTDIKNQQSMPVRRRPFMASLKRLGGIY